jgi:hypothetical protein
LCVLLQNVKLCFLLQTPCRGEAAVTQGGKVVNRLFKADYFGERALLSNEPRGATVVAAQETVCLVLDRDTFLEILGPLDKAMAVRAGCCLLGFVSLCCQHASPGHSSHNMCSTVVGSKCTRWWPKFDDEVALCVA